MTLKEGIGVNMKEGIGHEPASLSLHTVLHAASNIKADAVTQHMKKVAALGVPLQNTELCLSFDWLRVVGSRGSP